MIPDARCATCVFFSPPLFQFRDNGRAPKGQCRRHAPSLDRTEQGVRSVWPLVHDDAWCGEHATPTED